MRVFSLCARFESLLVSSPIPCLSAFARTGLVLLYFLAWLVLPVVLGRHVVVVRWAALHASISDVFGSGDRVDSPLFSLRMTEFQLVVAPRLFSMFSPFHRAGSLPRLLLRDPPFLWHVCRSNIVDEPDCRPVCCCRLYPPALAAVTWVRLEGAFLFFC